MGFLGNLIRKKLIKQTSQTIFSAYQKIKKENPNFNEREILELLLVLRRPFWGGDFKNITFKGHSAFILYDDLEIGGFIIMINIWESIIANPEDTRIQSININELFDMVKNVVDITFEVLGITLTTENISIKDSLVENYFDYSVDKIKQLK